MIEETVRASRWAVIYRWGYPGDPTPLVAFSDTRDGAMDLVRDQWDWISGTAQKWTDPIPVGVGAIGIGLYIVEVRHPAESRKMRREAR